MTVDTSQIEERMVVIDFPVMVYKYIYLKNGDFFKGSMYIIY